MEVQKTSATTDYALPLPTAFRPGTVQMADEPQAQAQARQVDNEYLSRLVDDANKAIANEQHLQFKVHEGTNQVLIRLVDDATGEVVREYPSEKFLDLVSELQRIAGVNVDVTL